MYLRHFCAIFVLISWAAETCVPSCTTYGRWYSHMYSHIYMKYTHGTWEKTISLSIKESRDDQFHSSLRTENRNKTLWWLNSTVVWFKITFQLSLSMTIKFHKYERTNVDIETAQSSIYACLDQIIVSRYCIMDVSINRIQNQINIMICDDYIPQ